MKLILTLFLFVGIHFCNAQTADTAGKYDPAKDTAYYYKQNECEIQVEYPGGPMVWKRFLDKNLYNRNETGQKIVVTVQFKVAKNGIVSDIQVLSGPGTGGYREEALRLIKKSGHWVSAIVNGHQVNAYKIVQIEFPAD